jgi:hypothetical protein
MFCLSLFVSIYLVQYYFFVFNVQDLLMICYLASVTKSQLSFGQKINQVIT